MARLNEPPVLGDSVEACKWDNFADNCDADIMTVKRRFIRQNREIARYVSGLGLITVSNNAKGQLEPVD
jgi:hypothetical protein